MCMVKDIFWGISIHALREEGDSATSGKEPGLLQFLSTPSARRATACCGTTVARYRVFLSTPSARRATWILSSLTIEIKFLSTPSARRATSSRTASSVRYQISIHALREEGDI